MNIMLFFEVITTMSYTDIINDYINSIDTTIDIIKSLANTINTTADDDLDYMVYTFRNNVTSSREAMYRITYQNDGEHYDQVNIMYDKYEELSNLVYQLIDDIYMSGRCLQETSTNFNYNYTKIYYKYNDGYMDKLDIIATRISEFDYLDHDEVAIEYTELANEIARLAELTGRINKEIMKCKYSIITSDYIPSDCSPTVRTFIKLINTAPRLLLVELNEVYTKYKK